MNVTRRIMWLAAISLAVITCAGVVWWKVLPWYEAKQRREAAYQFIQYGRSLGLDVRGLTNQSFEIGKGSKSVGSPFVSIRELVRTGIPDWTFDIDFHWPELTSDEVTEIVAAARCPVSGAGFLDGTESKGLNAVRHLTSLRSLSFENIRDTNVLVDLSDSSSLVSLYISGDALTDRAVMSIATLPNLEMLYLTSPNVTDASIDTLRRFPRLSFLMLQDCDIGEAALLSVLGSNKTIKTLWVSKTRVKDKARLAAAMPWCNVIVAHPEIMTHGGE